MATAQPSGPSDFEGRWTSHKGPTLDISRCGDGFCGVLVNNGACGMIALRASDKPPDQNALPRVPGHIALYGQLLLATGTQAYTVVASFSRDSAGSAALFIAGYTGGTFSMMRRRYDYQNYFARVGDATCRPDPKTS
jgi:hypothetical protein